MEIKLGIEILKEGRFREIRSKKIALLCNPASIDRSFVNSADIFFEANEKNIFTLKRLFGPQQGFFETQEANMIEWEGSKENRFGIPISSLYGKTRKPTPEMLKDIECLVIDLQDVGSKGYTFISTLYYVMEACEEAGIETLILDRPNPLGGNAEGPVTQEDFKSFVGIHTLPVIHGLTFGEAALLFKKEVFPRAKLKIIKMTGWKRSAPFDRIKRTWVPTSPNLPTFDSVIVYPGMELLEGTNLSEGRGTTRPFEQFGAPYIEPYELCKILNRRRPKGVYFRPISFTPTFDKWKDKPCYGAFLHIKDREQFSCVKTALEIVETASMLYPGDFQFKEPPYEYEFEKLPFDILIGNDYVRKDLLDGIPVAEIEKKWKSDLFDWAKRTKDILLYR